MPSSTSSPPSPSKTLSAIPQTGEHAPETVAVALAHNLENPDVPRVVATGKGWLAEQILELAFANGVKVRQDPDLVQVLAAVDVESDIPPEAFSAVAEILAYVYQANAAIAQGAPLPPFHSGPRLGEALP